MLFGAPMMMAGGLSNARSLTFTAASDQRLSRLMGTSGNRKTFTVPFYFKRASNGVQYIFSAGDGSANNTFEIHIDGSNRFRVSNGAGGSINTTIITNATFTDTAWHYGTLGVDTTQPVAADMFSLEIDGTEISSFATNTRPAQNTNMQVFGYATTSIIGDYLPGVGTYDWNGQMDELHWIDGLKLADSNFHDAGGKPVDYTGSFGTYGFRLRFEDPTSTTTLGADDSGNGNNWTLVNMTTANSSTDVP
jgi:hypothetical protein